MEKYNINDEVYIVYCDKIIKCKVTEITKNINDIKYKLLGENKEEYINSESTVYKNTEEADHYIKECLYNRKVNMMEFEISNYQKWVSELDFAIKNHDRCETIMKTVLISSETNGNDKATIFAVNNQGSKKLLDYIRKYFKEELDRREKELEEFKEENNGIKN